MSDLDRLATPGSTWSNSHPEWPESDNHIEGRPNVVVVLLDDVGFAQLGCYGSDIQTPNIDRLAHDGLRYNNFTVTALCSPTRASLLTGRNHHSVGMANIAEFVNGFQNTVGSVDERTPMLQEVLRSEGYNTFASGKWHLVPASEQTAAGPFKSWPLGRGFEKYYGFLNGETNHWNPQLVRDNQPVDPANKFGEGYHLTSDLVEKANSFIRDQRSVAPEKPFFLYLALGAGHDPHHAFPEDIDEYRGKYEQGWDAVRESWFANQKALGIIPEDADLADRDDACPAWDSLPEKSRKVFARMMEIYAAFLTHADREIGKLISTLEETGSLDNTVFLLLSDNGASVEGGIDGLINKWTFFNGIDVSVDDIFDRLDELGGPTTYNHYPLGWAQVGNTPFKWYKRWVHAGGVRAPLIVHWPAGIQSKGEIRSQFHHVSDIMPTILEACGVELPTTFGGSDPGPVDGTSMMYSFAGDSSSRKSTQYFEMFGNRAIWKDGWKAVTLHQRDVRWVKPQSFEDDKWELYRTDSDFSELEDLASEHPEKLASLIDEWWLAADSNGVLPLDDRLTGRDQRNQFRTLFKIYRDTAPINPFVIAHAQRTDHRISVEATLTQGDNGVILSQGGRFGGWALFMENGKLVYEYNFGDIHRYKVSSDSVIKPGQHSLEDDVKFEAAGQASVTLKSDGQPVGHGRVDQTFHFVMSMEPLTCGYESQTPVSESYEVPAKFTGQFTSVCLYIDALHGHRFETVEEAEGAVRSQ